MKAPPDQNLAPSNLDAIEAALPPGLHLPPLERHAAEVLRVLAASKPGGVALQAGSGSPALSAWLLDGMDITSRLVTVVNDGRLLPVVRQHVGNDIRVAIHSQDLLEFLSDIRAHRLQLIVFDEAPESIDLVQASLAMLDPGGLFIVLGAAPAQNQRGAGSAQDVLCHHGAFQSVRISAAANMLLAARKPAYEKRSGRGERRTARRRGKWVES